MISFSRLGQMGRLGNQLFQYAFLRTYARTLGRRFFCPKWLGDEIFLLNEGAKRGLTSEGIVDTYQEPEDHTGYNAEVLEAGDGTEFRGFFQTAKYFDADLVKKWYTFNDRIRSVREKYRHLDFAESVGLHVRFGDMVSYPVAQALFYLPENGFYARALERVTHKDHVLVFSDEPRAAEQHLSGVGGNFVFIEGNHDFEDLYLMTLCHDFVCSASTFSWWGAFLNRHESRTIIAPREGPFRPGAPVHNEDYWPEEWVLLESLTRGRKDTYRSVLYRNLRAIWKERGSRSVLMLLLGSPPNQDSFIRWTLGGLRRRLRCIRNKSARAQS